MLLSAMRHSLSEALRNIRGGLAGILVYLVITGLVYFSGFMAALGNDTPGARLVLAVVETYAMVASPLWAVPLSYIIGGCFFFSSDPGDDTVRGG